jgi:hypothetical protein
MMRRSRERVARPDGEAARARDAADPVATVEEALAELDAGRIDAAYQNPARSDTAEATCLKIMCCPSPRSGTTF